MSTDVLWHQFNEARKLAIEKHLEHAKEISQVQYRDLRAKAATDKSLASSDEEASKLLGHATVKMIQKV